MAQCWDPQRCFCTQYTLGPGPCVLGALNKVFVLSTICEVAQCWEPATMFLYSVHSGPRAQRSRSPQLSFVLGTNSTTASRFRIRYQPLGSRHFDGFRRISDRFRTGFGQGFRNLMLGFLSTNCAENLQLHAGLEGAMPSFNDNLPEAIRNSGKPAKMVLFFACHRLPLTIPLPAKLTMPRQKAIRSAMRSQPAIPGEGEAASSCA